ncbi:hypothetical protein ACFWHQ_07635 [Streptomyces sp. NPDC060334]|uniref:hypothetical protein n=1 Tax=unclassified Streptomyces TaxID=2593676 RepID=UPI00331CCA1D
MRAEPERLRLVQRQRCERDSDVLEVWTLVRVQEDRIGNANTSCAGSVVLADSIDLEILANANY